MKTTTMNMKKNCQVNQTRESLCYKTNETIRQILDSMMCLAFIVDDENRIVFSNGYSMDKFSNKDKRVIKNLKPGKLINCHYANQKTNNCGSAEHCRYCDLLNTINTSRSTGVRVSRECSLLAATEKPVLAFDLHVQAAPLHIGHDQYILISMTDISHEKRRRSLERLFFHDLINIAGGLKGLVDYYIEEHDPEILENIIQISHTILEEIYAQRDLAAAENGDLQVTFSPVNSQELLHLVQNSLAHHTSAIGKNIVVDPDSSTTLFFCDIRLLKRTLGNMVKNALEASTPGETITLGCKDHSNTVEFWVHNPAVMSPKVTAHIFHRSFSTKGNDRGLGAYSMKLLTEQYLHGSVDFHSAPGCGTIFRIHLPKVSPAKPG